VWFATSGKLCQPKSTRPTNRMTLSTEKEFQEVMRSYDKVESWCRGASRVELVALRDFADSHVKQKARELAVERRKLEIILGFSDGLLFSDSPGEVAPD